MALLPLLLSRRLTRWAPGCCHPPPRPSRVCSAPASSAAKDTPGAATAAGPRANTNGNTTRTRTTTTTTSPNANAHASNGDALHAARTWLAELHAQTIPIGAIGELTFSRSSGPGGQNVNKVNSKATLKVPLEALLRHVPAALHGELKRSRYLAANSSTLVVHADDSRKQSDNVRSCYRRLHDAIVDAGRNAVPAETSPEQVQRVKLLYVVAPCPTAQATARKADKTPVKNPITSAA